MIKEKSQGRSNAWLFKFLAVAAERLYELGFNVVPVDGSKKPIGSWSASERLTWEELEKRLPKASGIAITGNYFENSEYGVVILDLDDVDDAAKILGGVFGVDVGEVHVSTWPIRLCGQDHSFCGFTGPRPKGRVRCNCEKPNVDCDCVIEETGEHRKLAELSRGMYIVVRVPKRCLPSGTVRSDAIEVMVSNYEVVYGKHPSGAYYQPVKWVDGRWVPIGIEDVGQGEVITCDELKALIALVKQSTTNTLEELGKEDAKTAIELNLPEPARELSEESINQIVNSVRPIWWVETDEGKHTHDFLLYGLVSQMRRGGIKYEIARKVVEAIINAGLQDIAGKVDTNTLQAIMRNEERHFKETVDYVYTKPTAKLWGRKTFEEVLKPAIERAIEQGLLSGVSKPEEWFQAIYAAISERRRGKTEVDWDVLDEYLPPTKGEPANLSAWAEKLRIGDIEYCLSTPLCTKAIITHTREDSQYVLLAVREVITEEDENGNKREVHNYSPIALLPKYMGEVRDPFYDEWFYIALHDGKVLAVSSEFDDFIRAITNMPGGGYYVIRNTQYLNVINAFLPRVEQVISAGITDDGFVDPYGVLDVNDYGIEPLLKAYEWVRKYYPETNAGWAWFNVMAAFAKVLTPLVRYRNRTFNDMVVYNVGRGGEGKSSLVRYIILPLLGGEDAREKYHVVIDGPVRSEPQLRNLLSLNRLPLILDEQNKKALSANIGIFLSAVIGLGTIGVHAARYGLGIAVKFKNLRGMVVFTNVSFTSFLRDILSEASDYAIMRRFIEVPWDTEPINPTAFKDLPELKPIYGFATRLWARYKDELAKSADLLELIEKLAIAMGREYMGDAKVNEVVKYTLDIIKELREAKRNERLALNDAETLIANAYGFVSNEIKTPPSSAVKVLRVILENPSKAGLLLVGVKDNERAAKLANDLNNVIQELGDKYSIVEEQGKIQGADPDAVAVYSILKDALAKGKYQVVVLSKMPLIPGSPETFMGSPRTNVSVGGVRLKGYYLSLADFVRLFLHREDVVTGGSTEKSSEDESSPLGKQQQNKA
jgi:hypothetical protein